MIAVNPSRSPIGVDFRPKPRRPMPTPKRPVERQKRKSVTIAAGFKFKDGILLCADREITEGISKFSEVKVFGEQVGSNVSLAFTLAGAMDYAEMAIQEIIAVVKSSHLTTHAAIWGTIRDKVHDIYSESIGILPEMQRAESQFNLLVAVWAEGSHKLYVTENTAIKEVPSFRCIGIGRELAKYMLIRDGVYGTEQASLGMAEPVALRLLNHVKESVSGCGKETDVLIVGSDGVLTRKDQNDYEFELKLVELYDQMSRVLFAFSLELDMPDREREVGFWLALNNYRDRLKILQGERQKRKEEEAEDA